MWIRMTLPDDKAAKMTCPECGSTERQQKFRCVICADCRVVLDDQTPPTLSAVETEDGFRVV